MPTGYTYPVVEGKITDFKEFALQCSRAMGACISQRDEPPGPPKMEEVSPYYQESLDRALAAVQELESKSAAQFKDDLLEQEVKNNFRNIKSLEKNTLENKRLSEMLEQVQSWQPPSEDHQGFKNFMIQQLEISFSDCKYAAEQVDKYPESYKKIQQTPAEDLKSEEMKYRQKEVCYYREKLQEETKNVNSRNLWKQQLFNSLAGV